MHHWQVFVWSRCKVHGDLLPTMQEPSAALVGMSGVQVGPVTAP